MTKRTILLLTMLPIVVPSCADDSAPLASGGAAELELAGNSGSNVDTSPLPPTEVGVVLEDAASHTRVIGVFAFEKQGEFRRKAWQLALSIVGDPVVGATYTIAPASGSAALAYDQLPTTGSWLGWGATGGSISVESVSGTSATFALSSITMAPTTGGSGNAALGTFTLSGTITVDDI